VTVLDGGEHISLASCGLPYFLSGDLEQFQELVTTAYDVVRDPEYFAEVKDVQILTGTRAEKIDIDTKTVAAVDVASGEAKEFQYDELVIATGAKPVVPDIKGLDLSAVQTFTKAEDAIALKRAAAQGQLGKVAVIGGGFIGCELCEAFTALWGIKTTLFEFEDHILPRMLDVEMARIVELELQRKGVSHYINTAVSEIKETGKQFSVVTDFGLAFDGFDGVVVAAGVKPRVELALEAGIELGTTGAIRVNSKMQTNIPHIYAAGDCVESTDIVTGKPCYLPLGSIANRQGRVVGNVIAGIDDSFGAVNGSACLKVFDVNIAAVGLTVEAATDYGFEVGESWGVFTDRADYFPEAENISIKMVFDKKTRKVLGVQAASKGDAIRRIDAASVIISQGMTIEQVRDFEPAYAPPYATALDPLHYLAYIGISTLDEGLHSASPLDFDEIAGDFVVVDVREKIEMKEAPLTVAYRGLNSIPFTELRSRLDTIPKNDPLLVVCAKGVRSAEAARILKQNGFEDVRYVGGGLLFFQA
jgi:NADPH-dependent 2,4-dienoyl-CoA reductase/sulfur reductase-like enzyme/rhodanese-related sulfurtransferase